ncbi:hypothetical protein [Cohnella nanjingensis]|uniref:Uncharacterized protein n=1 Tax=Cohnella nanjingensis TaxID=1387779 RepID=A0A7X0RUT6_9BACL|nr:hypothetical protein [Cohnella nanjingensis]MBB6674103.1 hypothetical protein [Cohnella nanjingensis]
MERCETLKLLSFLQRSHSGSRVLVIATMRTDAYPGKAVRQFFAGLRTDRKLTEIELAPFSEEETKRLMAATIGDVLANRYSSNLFLETGGVPLFIAETLREWQTGGDGGLRPIPWIQSAIENG